MQKNNIYKNPIFAKPTLTSKIPSGDDFCFELKYDGYRIFAKKQNGKTILMSKNNLDFSKYFPSILKSIKNIKNDNFVLDGEVVCFDKEGRSDFSLLQKNLKSGKGGFVYVVFDVLIFENKSMQNKTLLQRKNILEKNFCTLPDNIMLSQYIKGNGKTIFDFAIAHNLEGVVAKKIDCTLLDAQWYKIKTKKRQEFVVGGFQTSAQNPYLSNMLLGYFKQGKFLYVGKVGTGFSQQMRMQLSKILSKSKVKTCPFCNMPKIANDKTCFVKPKYVAEVCFANFTSDGYLRQPVFVGMRFDKDPLQVFKEIEK